VLNSRLAIHTAGLSLFSTNYNLELELIWADRPFGDSAGGAGSYDNCSAGFAVSRGPG